MFDQVHQWGELLSGLHVSISMHMKKPSHELLLRVHMSCFMFRKPLFRLEMVEHAKCNEIWTKLEKCDPSDHMQAEPSSLFDFSVAKNLGWRSQDNITNNYG